MDEHRVGRLMKAAIETFELDLAGLTVLTEAATGYCALTPVLAAVAGADRVLALARDSRHGTAAEAWFRGRGEQHIRDVLLDPSARLGEYLDPAFVRESLDIHADGQKNQRLLIWSLLSFEHWLATFL